MYEKNINDLQMQIKSDNDGYYIERLNQMINESKNNGLIINSKNVKFIGQKHKKGCWEWFLGIFGCYKVEDEEDAPNFVGLVNIGNNCYLNAGLQILSRCYPLLIELLNYNYDPDKLMKYLVEVMKALIFEKGKYYNPSKFIECFCKLTNVKF